LPGCTPTLLIPYRGQWGFWIARKLNHETDSTGLHGTSSRPDLTTGETYKDQVNSRDGRLPTIRETFLKSSSQLFTSDNYCKCRHCQRNTEKPRDSNTMVFNESEIYSFFSVILWLIKSVKQQWWTGGML